MKYDIVLNSLTKVYDNGFRAVKDMSLSIEQGDLISLLGPSGCGKTTALRMVAGFVTPTTGTITIKGRDVTSIPPYERNTGMVFQNYALFPHMTVEENVAFGLKMRKVSKEEIQSKVLEVLEMVGVIQFRKSYPRQLSGGQQQRVALSRVLAINPDVLLLDEPLSALDRKLREQVRMEIRQLQKKVGITTIFVTHDQEEALTLSDYMVIMEKGEIVQRGTPEEIYSNPANKFVADFLGISNILHCTVKELVNKKLHFTIGGDSTVFDVPSPQDITERMKPGSEIKMVIRPESITMEDQPFTGSVGCTINNVVFMGSMIRFYIILDEAREQLIVDKQNIEKFRDHKPGSKVHIKWHDDDVIILH